MREGSLKSHIYDDMERWKAEIGRVREKQRRSKKIKEEKVRRKKIQMREKEGRKVAKHCASQIVAPAGPRVGSLKRLLLSHLARWDEKLHVVVAGSKFPSQDVQSTPGSDHLWKLSCRKSSRRCGAKHVSQKCLTLTVSEDFWKLRCRKRAHCWSAKRTSKSKCEKLPVRTAFGHPNFVLRGRRKGLCILSCSSFNYNNRYATLHYATLHYATLHHITRHYSTLH